MSMIQVEHLTFSYPGSYDTVFDGVSFRLDTDWKLGLIGRNGRGKTTLLRLLQGGYEYSGTISASVSFDYFPYSVPDPGRPTGEILEEICPQAAEWERLRELNCLQVGPDVLWRGFDTLSNGERTKVLLAALFLRPGNFLLIDEPTNHLDAAGRMLVASYLKRKKGFILVSHDRAFLDGCVDHIMSINRRDIQIRSGGYTAWREDYERREQAERERSAHLKKDIGRLEDSARRAAVWSGRVESSKVGNGPVDRGFIGAQSARMMKRSKNIQRRREQAVEEKSALLKNAELEEELKLSPLEHYARELVRLEDVSVRYGERAVCEHISFSLRQGERLALEGRNGCGKSSLLKLILGRDIPHTGLVTTASGLVISYVAQDTTFLRGNLSGFAREQGIDESLLKAILRKMAFERVQFEKDMSDFSGGQKKKVLLAASLCRRAHVYLWDEPLNFIDIDSRIQIEGLLCRTAPTMIFVEHDRAFREAVATRRVEL